MIIEHKVYGRGKIQKKRFGGFELYVEFEDGISRWVRKDEVRVLTEIPILTKREPLKPVLPKEQFKARQIIEALRLGIVPYDYVNKFTFGREKEIERVIAWLNGQRGSLIITGEYGSGKSHFLEYLYSYALKNNWAVSLVELDPNEAPLHKPKVIYEKIISSFKFKGNMDFREFLKQIAGSRDFYKLKYHEYLGRVIEEIRNGTDDEDTYNWIEGKPTWYHHPPMYGYSTCANIYCYILSGIGWAARNILGMNGFLVLFDEAESVDPYWYSSYQNRKGWNFLTGLILMANNDERLLMDEVEARYSWSGFSEGYWGKYTGLQYCGYSQLPFIWRSPCYVKLIFTFTPVPWILNRNPLNNVDKLELEHLSINSLQEMSRRISELYEQAYGFRSTVKSILEFLPRDKTRLFIKGMVEALDLMRFHPDKSVEELLR